MAESTIERTRRLFRTALKGWKDSDMGLYEARGTEAYRAPDIDAVEAEAREIGLLDDSDG